MPTSKEAPTTGRKGRKASAGARRRQFLATLDADLILALKTAALEDGTSASHILDRATRDWLDRRKSERGKKR
jgi:hypothetical protein